MITGMFEGMIAQFGLKYAVERTVRVLAQAAMRHAGYTGPEEAHVTTDYALKIMVLEALA